MFSENDYHHAPAVLTLVSFANYTDSGFNHNSMQRHYMISQHKNDVQSDIFNMTEMDS